MTGKDSPSGKWLLVSDIDDTLTGDRDALMLLWTALKASSDHIGLVLNSSRPAVSVDTTLLEEFPEDFQPTALITGLGTEIRLAGKNLQSWHQQFTEWPDQKVRDLIKALGYVPHPDIFQTEGKASFAVPGRADVQRIFEQLRMAGIAFKSIYSGASDLDILAPGAGKDAAMRHLADHLGIPLSRTIAAGDSGNDLALFEAAGQAIAVGNAREELLSALPKQKTFLARAHHAAGVHEGLTALGLIR